MATQIPVGMKAPFTIGGFKDAAGNDTVIDKVTSVVLSDAAAGDLLDQGEDLASGAVAPNAAGTFQLQVTVDVRVGEGVKELLLIADVEGVAGEAVTGSISFGEAVPR